MTLAAIDPRRNAVVHAAAGTGKTWLLVSRVIRLLIEGAKPSSILAITFTRKAAAEMRLRVGERLLEMCETPDAELRLLLEQIGVPPAPDTLSRARRLYEELLVAPHELRATTFHAFCQELLSRFAFDAGVPPSFEVIELTAELEAAAWRALDRELAGRDGDLSAAMERLLRSNGGLDNTRNALHAFFVHRSDWWAYTENEPDPVGYAARRLQDALEIDPQHDPVDRFAHDPEIRELAQSLIAGLGCGTPPSLAPIQTGLHEALAAGGSADFYRLVCKALYTKNNKKPRGFQVTKPLARLLGPADAETLVRRHRRLLDRLAETTEQCRRYATWHRTRDWYIVGTRLLHHFQDAKRADGVLDFADLEWCAYRLLNESGHAEWVQYKLDRRIDHLLVDEFQDTNPTQWRLLLPLLQEMAAGSSERRRSVFLVGDEKQSIYRFRRADPELFMRACDWLAEHTRAEVYDQHISWRSSPAVVRFVNLLFDVPATDTPDADDHTLQNFRTHETHRQELWGHAELLPLVMRDANEAPAAGFRDPLAQPREPEEDRRREREGRMLADKIRSLIGRPISHKGEVRPIRYGDIMILVRRRTHTAWYEAALRHAGIPYVGAGRGTFLQCLEVRDIVNLLRLLISPWENVALAGVLRSPIFAAGNDDLLALADLDAGATWYDRLVAHYRGDDPASPLPRAARLLSAWRRMADRVPVHDLLDRIYFDANVPERYQSAAPPHLRQRIAANLTRLLDLALEADGGRFPSLARFLARLEVLTEEDNESLDADVGEAGDQVRLLTIHAAKGLESPVVFLVDAARDTNSHEHGAEALVEWPIEQTRPTDFVLLAKKKEADSYTRALLERRDKAAFQEETNLLYVALTRAQQLLFVSGCESGRRKADSPGRAGDRARGWYGHIERRFEAARASGDAAKYELQLQAITVPAAAAPVNLCGWVSHGLPPVLPPQPVSPPVALVVDPALTRPFGTQGGQRTAALEDTDESALPTDVNIAAVSAAKQRGVVIHRMLERLTADGAERGRAKHRVWREFAAGMDGDRLTDCWNEACAVVDAPDLRRFFDPQLYQQARNEVAVLYRDNDREVTGIIDRLVFYDDRLVLIDYKTHSTTSDQLPALVERYTPQLRLYAEGLRRLWPGRRVEAVLLFTAHRLSAHVDV